MADDPGIPTTFWVDVSHHDWNRRGGNLDWGRVLAQTSPVMCARATYGDPAGWNRVTHRFGDFQMGAKAVGFTVRGGYHNLIRGDANSMMRQADWLSRVLDAQGCNWGMADIERYAELLSAGLWPRWQDVLRFRDAWYATARPAMSWYLPQWVYNASGFSGGDLNELPGLFIQSHYAGGDGTLTQIYANAGGDSGTGWDDCFGQRCPDGWQFTAVANVDGASDQTDVNAFRGTLDQLRALIGPAAGIVMKGHNDMLLIKTATDNTVYVSDGHEYRPLGPDEPAGSAEAAYNAATKAGHKPVEVADMAQLEAIAGRPAAEPEPVPVTLSEADRQDIAARVAALMPTAQQIAAATGALEADADRARADVLDGPAGS